MKRRDFIVTTALGSSAFYTGRLLSAIDFTKSKEKGGEIINPIIPILIFPGFEDEIESDIIDLNKRYGLKRFLIVGPAGEWVDSRIELLNNDGEWRSARVSKQDRTITVNEKLAVMNPVVLRLLKA